MLYYLILNVKHVYCKQKRVVNYISPTRQKWNLVYYLINTFPVIVLMPKWLLPQYREYYRKEWASTSYVYPGPVVDFACRRRGHLYGWKITECAENNLLLHLLFTRLLKWEFYPVRAYILFCNHVSTILR